MKETEDLEEGEKKMAKKEKRNLLNSCKLVTPPENKAPANKIGAISWSGLPSILFK